MLRALCLVAAACVHAPEAPSPSARAGVSAGTYRVYSRVEDDTCGGEIHLATRTLIVLDDLKRVHADVVERDYSASIENDRLIAEGIFPESSCPKAELHERWRLEPLQGGLVGVLKAVWTLPSDCKTPCEVLFSVWLFPEPTPVTL
jgi:hypothetical protein